MHPPLPLHANAPCQCCAMPCHAVLCYTMRCGTERISGQTSLVERLLASKALNVMRKAKPLRMECGARHAVLPVKRKRCTWGGGGELHGWMGDRRATG
jgi:hypothetical protein